MPTPPIHPPLPVLGFRVASVACGIKKNGARDLAVIAVTGPGEPATMAAVFTRNAVRAAPVEWCRTVRAGQRCHAIVVNSGNANACTGAQGADDTRQMARLCGDALGIPAASVAVASTGVIGQPLPMDRVGAGIDAAIASLPHTDSPASAWADAADALRTTDTVPKWHSETVTIAGQPHTITGIAKGSGMIHPNMATMLGFLVTDAPVAPAALQTVLADAVDGTFNRITVDGDTSTNDCVIALARGNGAEINPDHPDLAAFAAGVQAVCAKLALAIVADGEGATKQVEISVHGARNDDDALAFARQVAGSSLVKTALFGADPNWGRIVAAVGQAAGEREIPLDLESLALTIGDVSLLRDGAWTGEAAEAKARAVMATTTYPVTIAVGNGHGHATVWTCDLTDGYVHINADYRT